MYSGKRNERGQSFSVQNAKAYSTPNAPGPKPKYIARTENDHVHIRDRTTSTEMRSTGRSILKQDKRAHRTPPVQPHSNTSGYRHHDSSPQLLRDSSVSFLPQMTAGTMV